MSRTLDLDGYHALHVGFRAVVDAWLAAHDLAGPRHATEITVHDDAGVDIEVTGLAPSTCRCSPDPQPFTARFHADPPFPMEAFPDG